MQCQDQTKNGLDCMASASGIVRIPPSPYLAKLHGPTLPLKHESVQLCIVCSVVLQPDLEHLGLNDRNFMTYYICINE